MSRVIASILAHARTQGDSIALESGSRQLDYSALDTAVRELATQLRQARVRTVGLYADNSIAWALADLACLAAGLRVVPIPLFFTPAQTRHALASSGADAVLAHPLLPETWDSLTSPTFLHAAGATLALHRIAIRSATVPEGTRKITYTSGTTGAPKGVCLALDSMEAVAESLCDATGANAQDRHLCALPLPTLLENIGGLYAPLLAGATVCLRSSADVGLQGASGFDPRRCLEAIRDSRATTLILVPELLHALVRAIEAGVPAPSSLRFVAVGGAPVAPRLLASARRLGLPVYEGYGLSECSSVVALNTSRAARLGSVGRPLPHLRVHIGSGGEILVSGNAYLGYVGETPRDPSEAVATGDLGHLDEDGFLHITGRRKNMFITAFGRNVAPEWVERELCLHPAIAQVAVFGEARPWNVAVVVPQPGADPDVIALAIIQCNQALPDYARVSRWLLADRPFSPANDQATPNGRLRRLQIESHYRHRIEALYEEHCDVIS